MKVVALTAKATHATYRTICKSLMLKDPVLIGCQPNRHNITYEVKPLLDMNSFCGSVAEEVKMQGLSYSKTKIFVCSYNDCAALYHTFKIKLGNISTELPTTTSIFYHLYVLKSNAERKERTSAIIIL